MFRYQRFFRYSALLEGSGCNVGKGGLSGSWRICPLKLTKLKALSALFFYYGFGLGIFEGHTQGLLRNGSQPYFCLYPPAHDS